MIVDSITNSTAGEFDFPTIPGGYSRLILQGYVRSTEPSVTSDFLYLFFNGDFTAANYHRQRLSAANGSTPGAAEDSTPTAAIVTANDSPSGAYAQIKITMGGYDNSSIIKGSLGVYSMMHLSTTGLFVGMMGMSHKTLTDEITRVTVRATNHPTRGLVGTLRLYAEN